MLEPPGDGPRGGIRAPNPPCDAQGGEIRHDGGLGVGIPTPFAAKLMGHGGPVLLGCTLGLLDLGTGGGHGYRSDNALN